MEFLIATKEGQYDVEAHVRSLGEDLLVAISGGEKPHIGAVAVAQPRPSLKDPTVTSATVSVICCIGHKEDDLAKQAAEKLAASLNTRVVVTAGIHWDNLSEEGIQKVIRNCRVLLERIADRIEAESPFPATGGKR
ncbi:MAG: prenylated flavin chaperone LpdD [Thermodesulfobacteriota bacterium]